MARDCDGIEQLRIYAEFGGELWLHSRLKIRLNVRLRNTHREHLDHGRWNLFF